MVPPGIAPVTVQEEALRTRGGGGLHPTRPDWWAQTKRPRATPGTLIATSMTNLSHQQGLPPCLRTSPTLGGTLGVHQTS